MLVPALMASEGWDDHSRAHRRTGVDFAKNYLDSLQPNAILFTNGDNDTFPLWYVQEVEGYRTDVHLQPEPAQHGLVHRSNEAPSV